MCLSLVCLMALGMMVSTCASSAMFIIPLEKQRVPVTVNGRVVSQKAAYFGTVQVGYTDPQNFTVVFDTGSAHFILPSTTCRGEACTKHRRYERAASSSAIDINHDGTRALRSVGRDQVSVSYGTGAVAGEFVSEVACLGSPRGVDEEPPHKRMNCARARLIHAHEMSAEPFSHFQFDGVLGLGLEALALDPEFNFFSQMTRGGRVAPVFAVFLAPGDDAGSNEIAFGGHNEARAAGPLHWVSVASPEKGYWQVSIKHVYVGPQNLELCNAGDCVAILDTGMSSLGVPQKTAPSIHVQLARPVPPESPADVDCRTVPGLTLTFDLGGFSIELEPSDYSRPAAMHIPRNDLAGVDPYLICRASLIPLDLPSLGPNAFLLGEPVLQKYYTAYDTHRKRIGFSRAVEPSATSVSVSSLSPASEGRSRRWSVDRGVVLV